MLVASRESYGFIVIYFDEEEKTNIFEGFPPLPSLSSAPTGGGHKNVGR